MRRWAMGEPGAKAPGFITGALAELAALEELPEEDICEPDPAVVTFTTNLPCADQLVAALDLVLAPHTHQLDPPDHMVLLSALRSSLANAANDARP